MQRIFECCAAAKNPIGKNRQAPSRRPSQFFASPFEMVGKSQQTLVLPGRSHDFQVIHQLALRWNGGKNIEPALRGLVNRFPITINRRRAIDLKCVRISGTEFIRSSEYSIDRSITRDMLLI
jgi:hypothetical protein